MHNGEWDARGGAGVVVNQGTRLAVECSAYGLESGIPSWKITPKAQYPEPPRWTVTQVGLRL